MVYGDTGRYPLYIESTVNSLRYWLKVRKMPMTRFPKQTLTMLENDLDMYTSTSTSNWAGDIKQCLESYGFQDVWTDGAVNGEKILYSKGKWKNASKKNGTQKYSIAIDLPPTVYIQVISRSRTIPQRLKNSRMLQ